jgi:hypothetical protein
VNSWILVIIYPLMSRPGFVEEADVVGEDQVGLVKQTDAVLQTESSYQIVVVIQESVTSNVIGDVLQSRLRKAGACRIYVTKHIIKSRMKKFLLLVDHGIECR